MSFTPLISSKVFSSIEQKEPISPVDSTPIITLEQPSKTERAAKLIDNIFTAIVKGATTMTAVGLGALCIQDYIYKDCFPETARAPVRLVSTISVGLAGIGLAISACASKIVQKKEEDRIQHIKAQLKHDFPNFSLITVRFK